MISSTFSVRRWVLGVEVAHGIQLRRRKIRSGPAASLAGEKTSTMPPRMANWPDTLDQTAPGIVHWPTAAGPVAPPVRSLHTRKCSCNGCRLQLALWGTVRSTRRLLADMICSTGTPLGQVVELPQPAAAPKLPGDDRRIIEGSGPGSAAFPPGSWPKNACSSCWSRPGRSHIILADDDNRPVQSAGPYSPAIRCDTVDLRRAGHSQPFDSLRAAIHQAAGYSGSPL